MMIWDDIVKAVYRIREPFILITLFILSSICVALYTSNLYSREVLSAKAKEVEEQLANSEDIARSMEELLKYRPDIVYLSLLDRLGVVRKSYGIKSGEAMTKFTLSAPDGGTIVLGLRKMSFHNLLGKAFFWGAAISLAFAFLYMWIRSLLKAAQSKHLDRVLGAIKSAAYGDYGVRVDVTDPMFSTVDHKIADLCEGVNYLLDQIAKREGFPRPEASKFQPQVIKGQAKAEPSMKKVVTLVNKISSLEESPGLTAEEYNHLVNTYRKEAATIVAKYGGVIEAILQDEIVAFFNIPEELDKPELRAIFSGVEVLQTLATLNREMGFVAERSVSGKIGIDCRTILLDQSTGLPRNVKYALTLPREIAKAAPNWKVIVSEDIYNTVSEFVDARAVEIKDQKFYSIMGVDEEAIEM